jgi:ABC-type bacteriocin/lantibiotic exporter with double-glycine peptidase domain
MLLIPYAAQTDDGACLPACAQMVLGYLGQPVSQARLVRLFGTNEVGTPFSRLRLLAQLKMKVEVRTDGILTDLRTALHEELPVIVAIHAGWLPDTPVTSQHAVVVIGIADDGVYVLDPARDDHPILLSEHAFLAAWIEMDCVFAVLRR